MTDPQITDPKERRMWCLEWAHLSTKVKTGLRDPLDVAREYEAWICTGDRPALRVVGLEQEENA